ncbi:serine hydrolase domain-containing protein [Solilutibacter silvestris]|uniref:Beta-lactamase class C and other penicillin binding protein n=1 Tax=Solilutibacter silvestris TaxID=1645665 RepID=A0A2K1Q1R6_9GAMM|nr:serine hydrolase domain-containing protein [Lysobacter silvestris]PNS08982.1 Beta-lactamase class C and other penicillin binding protein [Lysobacter silvestris]
MNRALAALLATIACGTAFAADPVAQVRFTFDRDHILTQDARGFADVAAQRRITIDDPARIASISKLVTTLGVMRLVELGKLNLDEDVSKQLGWKLRNPAFADTPITLRMLLSHTSSLTDEAGYWNVALDEDIRDLAGNPKAWDSAHAPGTWFRYTNLNFPIVASVMERASGERFDVLMQHLVLKPLGLHACFNWSGCDAATIARAVVLYDANGKPEKDDLHGQTPDCVVIKERDGSCDLSHWVAGRNGTLFAPQGGLRISVLDLAKIGQLLLNEGRIGKARFLKPTSVRMMLASHWRYDGHDGDIGEMDEPQRGSFFCSYGYATQQLGSGDGKRCRDDLFGDGRLHVGHSGNAYGLLSGVWIDPKSGTGVAYFATGVENAASGAHSAFSAIEEQMATGR